MSAAFSYFECTWNSSIQTKNPRSIGARSLAEAIQLLQQCFTRSSRGYNALVVVLLLRIVVLLLCIVEATQLSASSGHQVTPPAAGRDQCHILLQYFCSLFLIVFPDKVQSDNGCKQPFFFFKFSTKISTKIEQKLRLYDFQILYF